MSGLGEVGEHPGSISGAGPPARAQALDILRAFAATTVLTYHVWLYRLPNPNRPTRESWLDFTFFELRVGLVVFFVLSGYLLYRPLIAADGTARMIKLGRYYWRRIVRIVPTYYVAIALSIVLLWGLGDVPGVRLPDGGDLWLFAVLFQNFSRETLLTLNSPTWTLAVQAAFYTVFPVILFSAVLLRRRAWIVPLVLIALGMAWNWIAWENEWGPISRLALPAMMPYMALGMLIAHLPRIESARAVWATFATGIAMSIGNGLWHALGTGAAVGGVLRDIPGAIGFALMIAALAQPLVGSVVWLRPIEALGRWSYGVFLFHLPLLLWLKGNQLMPDSAVLTWLLVMALAAAAGALSWRIVERPLLARSRSSFGRGLAPD